MSRAWWIIVLVVAVAVSAGGCASGGGTSSAPAQKAGSVEETLAALSKLPAAERQKKLEEEAKKEGKVVIYATGSIDSWEAFEKDFEKKYPGVNMEVLRAGSDELLDRMLTEHRAGKLPADILKISKMHVLQDEGLTTKYNSPVKDAIPAHIKGEDYADFDTNMIVIAWNTNLVKPEDAPKKWEDLLDPKWKGRKMALDVVPDAMMYGLYSKWGVERGRDFMRKLLAQDLIPSRSHTTALDQLAAGEFPLCVEIYGYNAVNTRNEKKAPIAWLSPDPAATTGGGMTIASITTRPHAAALAYDYLLSPEAGTIYGTFGRMSAIPGAKLKYPDDQLPMLQNPGLFNAGPDVYRKLYDTVQKDLKEIVDPMLAQ